MPVDLSKPASQVDFATAAYEPLPERHQANIPFHPSAERFAPSRPSPASL